MLDIHLNNGAECYYNYYKKNNDVLKDAWTLSDEGYEDINYYINNALPFPISIDADSLQSVYWNDVARKKPDYSVNLDIGIGLGRIIDVSPISRAAEFCKCLGENLDPELIDKLAEVIGKKLYYQYLYWDSFKKEYYNMLNRILGNKYDALELERIDSDTGTVYPSKSGFHFSALYEFDYQYSQQNPMPEITRHKFRIGIEYYQPIGSLLELDSSASCSQDLDDFKDYDITMSAGLSLFINNTWSSYVSVGYEFDPIASPGEMSLQAGSSIRLFQRFYAGGYFDLYYRLYDYRMYNFNIVKPTLEYLLNISFTYYLI
jgi:hypothetical protein